MMYGAYTIAYGLYAYSSTINRWAPRSSKLGLTRLC